MPVGFNRARLFALAKIVALTRIEQLQEEIDSIRRAFGLTAGGQSLVEARGRRGRMGGPRAAASESVQSRLHRRGKLSAAGRAAISRAQKAR